LWQRFSVKDPRQHLWYYRSLRDVYAQRVDNRLLDELTDVLDTLERDPSIGLAEARSTIGSETIGASPRGVVTECRALGSR
jgi:hypothetical protein